MEFGGKAPVNAGQQRCVPLLMSGVGSPVGSLIAKTRILEVSNGLWSKPSQQDQVSRGEDLNVPIVREHLLRPLARPPRDKIDGQPVVFNETALRPIQGLVEAREILDCAAEVSWRPPIGVQQRDIKAGRAGRRQ
jgi:hypothetical protein